MLEIDKSDIPLKMLDKDFFIQFESAFQAFLSQHDNQRAVCVHEAAHALFIYLSGGTDVALTGPVISIRDNVLVAEAANTKAESFDLELVEQRSVAQNADAVARAHAAGSAAVEQLLNSPYYGDNGDIEIFTIWFESRRDQYGFTDSPDVAWAKVRDDVKRILREKPQLRETVLTMADEADGFLFAGPTITAKHAKHYFSLFRRKRV